MFLGMLTKGNNCMNCYSNHLVLTLYLVHVLSVLCHAIEAVSILTNCNVSNFTNAQRFMISYSELCVYILFFVYVLSVLFQTKAISLDSTYKPVVARLLTCPCHKSEPTRTQAEN